MFSTRLCGNSSETELRLFFLQYCDLPPLINVEESWDFFSSILWLTPSDNCWILTRVSRSLDFQITKIVAIFEKKKKKTLWLQPACAEYQLGQVKEITCWSSRLFKNVGEGGPYYLLFCYFFQVDCHVQDGHHNIFEDDSMVPFRLLRCNVHPHYMY